MQPSARLMQVSALVPEELQMEELSILHSERLILQTIPPLQMPLLPRGQRPQPQLHLHLHLHRLPQRKGPQLQQPMQPMIGASKMMCESLKQASHQAVERGTGVPESGGRADFNGLGAMIYH